MKIETIATRAVEIEQKKGLRASWDYLAKHIDDMETSLKLMRELQKAVEQEAFKRDLGCMVRGEPREIGPTREMFIAVYGVAAWNAIKRWSNPTLKFHWLE